MCEEKLIIPGELPDLNTIITKAKLKRKNYQAYSQLKEKYTDLVAWSAKEQKIKKYKKIDLVVTFYCKNKRKDKDNILAGLKFILDGLVKAGVIENDGWKQIGKFENIDFKVDKYNPRIEVILKEV
ncbi:hypothetical protein [Caminicella sporogenes]|uniref:hypothetical protein n=1 Tax=Caminicella sporogenes TaxID=166485 RepID=UPI0025410823|nr:hypothetical protein [Caminicella sporogenes]WIF95148.1 hypothetical protein QNI18_00470 [Caminicella sporogenes]